MRLLSVTAPIPPLEILRMRFRMTFAASNKNMLVNHFNARRFNTSKAVSRCVSFF
jgi:hypothetical protein